MNLYELTQAYTFSSCECREIGGCLISELTSCGGSTRVICGIFFIASTFLSIRMYMPEVSSGFYTCLPRELLGELFKNIFCWLSYRPSVTEHHTEFTLHREASIRRGTQMGQCRLQARSFRLWHALYGHHDWPASAAMSEKRKKEKQKEKPSMAVASTSNLRRKRVQRLLHTLTTHPSV